MQHWPNRPPLPQPNGRATPKPKPTTSTGPRAGDLRQAKVYFIEANGDVYLELADISPDELMGYIPVARLGNKQYQEGQAASVRIVALQDRGGEKVAECEPTGVSELQGIVKWFDEQKGYGFIKPDGGGKDVYVHKNRLIGVTRLREGERVLFKIGKGMKGPEAQDVRLLEE
jgi:cold shock protein